MKSLKILTFVNANNYGALLQAFALQEVCKGCGFDTSFINYKFIGTKPPFFNRIIPWLRRSGFRFLYLLRIAERPPAIDLNSFIEFRRKYLNVDDQLYTRFTEFKLAPPLADVYITGSDQVWSTRIVSISDLNTFFLCFGSKNTKRVSYAASLGGEPLGREHIQSLKQNWIGLDACSVRELDRTGSLEKLGISKYSVVPDPTLLLDWSSRNELSIVRERTCDVGLFVLNPKNRQKCLDVAGFISLENSYFEINVDTDNRVVCPFVWIENISRCSFFVTDSYHAIIFAIITNTEFAGILLEGDGADRNVRIIELLQTLGLENRCGLRLDKSEVEALRNHKIDWADVQKRISTLRKKGLDFLSGI